MVTEKEEIEIKKEAEEIADELCAVFNDRLRNLMQKADEKNIIRDIVKRTLVLKANRNTKKTTISMREEDKKMVLSCIDSNLSEIKKHIALLETSLVKIKGE